MSMHLSLHLPLKTACALVIAACATTLACVKVQPRDPAALVETRQSAPTFELSDHKGQSHTLAQHLERGPLAIVFYRGHW